MDCALCNYLGCQLVSELLVQKYLGRIYEYNTKLRKSVLKVAVLCVPSLLVSHFQNQLCILVHFIHKNTVKEFR